jgi:hypothetical protein
MIVAVILNKRMVLMQSTLVCVGEHWKILGKQKLLDLYVDSVSLASKVHAIGKPAWRPHSVRASYLHGNHHLWRTEILWVLSLGESRKGQKHPKPL